jgi:hypothetical protein
MIGPTDVAPSYNPAQYTNGTGMFSDSYHATTTMSTMVTADSAGACTYNLMRQNVVTVTGDNKLHIEFTNNVTNALAACAPTPPAGSCTSTYTYDASM